MDAFGKRRAELLVADDRTSPIAARLAYEQLVDVEKCDVVIASISSASMDAIRPRAMTRQALLLHAALSERGPEGKNYLQFGETPRDQLWRSIPSIMSATNAANWFILGSDYVWPRSVGMVANELIAQHNGRIAGERYATLGTANFDEVIDTIASSGADLILSSLVGSDAVRFERAFYGSGKRADFRTLATLIDDSTLEHIGREAATGIWSVQDYFMPTLADEMDDAARRYHARFGDLAPRLTSMAKTAYDTCHLYAEATQAAHSFEPSDVSAAFRSGKIGGSRLRSRVSGLLTPTLAAEATPGGFRNIGLG
jgi:urea transport system substrate-binding protein